MKTRLTQAIFMSFVFFELFMITACGTSQPVILGEKTTASSTGATNTGAASAGTADVAPVSQPALSVPAVITPVQTPIAKGCTVDPHRPNMLEMSNLGVDGALASDLVYGVIGSNTDTRNWSAILAHGAGAALIQAAREATRQMYGSPYCRSANALRAPFNLGSETMTIITQVANLQYVKVVNTSTGESFYLIELVDFEGYLLGSDPRRFINFGVSQGDLDALRARVGALGYPTSMF